MVPGDDAAGERLNGQGLLTAQIPANNSIGQGVGAKTHRLTQREDAGIRVVPQRRAAQVVA